MKALIQCVGFIGDNLFASSIPDKLKQQGYSKVDLQLSIAQPLELLKLNPNIDNVFLYEKIDYNDYSKVFNLQPIHRKETPTIQLQQQCGVLQPSSDYKIYTNPAQDAYVIPLLKHAAEGRKLVAYMSNWVEKTFGFTEEEYKKGVDVPNLGYGGRRRDTGFIVEELSKDDTLYLLPVGMPAGFNQREVVLDGVSNYTLTTSMIKACDWFIGAEGGLANLAAGVGTKTIITGDYVHQLYGWNGVIERNQEPKLGPKYYFPEGHYTLDPYLTDEEIIKAIKDTIWKN
jgi:ADP-heptose:LPS heptosyltransferase